MTNQRDRSLWPNVIALCLFGGVIGAMVLPAIQDSGHRRRPQCMNNLRGLVQAVTNYASAHGGALPPAVVTDASGRPMHSWRVLMLPYLDERALYDEYRFDEPWDGPNNRKLHDRMPKIFCCPDDQGRSKSMTSYLAVVGPETAWTSRESVTLDRISAEDGLANTLLLVEVADSGIHWMEPRDLDFASMSFRINDKSSRGVSSHHPGLAIAAFADTKVKALSETMPPQTVRALLTRNGGEAIGEDDY